MSSAGSSAGFHDRDGWIWFDGEMIPWREANVHILTHALHYASSVFEGQRSYDGEIFRLTEHSQRLVDSAAMLDFEIPYSVEEIDAAANEVMKVNDLPNAYFRPVAWRGSEQMGVSAQLTKVHLAVAAWEWPSYWPMEQRLKGLRLDISDWKRPSPETIPCKSKAAGLYMICTMSKHKAEAKGYDDSLFFDYKGRISEATGAHVFFTKDGTIHTPTTDCILEGITRKAVIESAQNRGFEIVVRDIMPDELEGFEQSFLTGTAAEVTPISEIGPYNFEVGEICKALMKDYDDLVHRRQVGA